MHKTESAWHVITEYSSGHSLDDLLALATECDRWCSLSFTLYIGAEVASALEYAHTAMDEEGHPLGIVHRAIDLNHVFVDGEGTVQVSDFGLVMSR